MVNKGVERRKEKAYATRGSSKGEKEKGRRNEKVEERYNKRSS